jgi:hypothetical protein
MAWGGDGAQYGRWEARVKSPAADPTYNAVMLLWPDAENWPAGGEVDFMEIDDPTRQETDFFLHYGAGNDQLDGGVVVDATQWHNWAVEWSPEKITAYVDGQPWFDTTRTAAFPPGPMHLTLQLDWFPGGGTVRQSAMHVDWVRYYPVTGTGPSEVPQNSPDTTSDTGTVVGTQPRLSTNDGTVGDSQTEGGSQGTGGPTPSATNATTVDGATGTMPAPQANIVVGPTDTTTTPPVLP